MLTDREKERLVAAVIDAVQNLAPEDVYDDSALKEWAEENGFVEEPKATE